MLVSNPPVTWLMAVKNGMPYLPLTLESIAAQTYNNFKILVWDNGSTDGTLEILRGWIPERLPGSVIEDHPMRLGHSMAALVERADTELCAVIHGDDVNLPIRLEREVEFLNSHPEAGIVGSNVRIIDETGKEGDLYIFATDDADIRWKNIWKNQLCHPSVMFRRSVILDVGNYLDCYTEDANLWIRAGRRTQIRNIGEVLLKYRRTATSQTGRIVDWVPVCRLAAHDTAAYLFPNISDARRAMELWEVTLPEHWNKPIKLKHWRELRQAAVRLAEETGQAPDYFTNTNFFREQEYHLRRRVLEKFGLGPAIRLRTALADRKGPLRSRSG